MISNSRDGWFCSPGIDYCAISAGRPPDPAISWRLAIRKLIELVETSFLRSVRFTEGSWPRNERNGLQNQETSRTDFQEL